MSLVVAVLGGCAGPRGEAARAPVTLARTGAAPPVTVVPNPPPVHAGADPLLVATFGERRAAILIGGDAPKVAGRVTVTEREPILSLAVSVAPEKVPAAAQGKIEARYTLVTPSGKTCLATREDVAVMSRIVSDDPTADKDEKESDSDYVKRMFERGERGVVVMVKLGEGCDDDALFAVPEGAPLPIVLPKTAPPSPEDLDRVAKAFDSDLARELTFTSSAFGRSLVWMHIDGVDTFTPGPCLAIDRSGARLEVVGGMMGCPEDVRAATTSATGETIVWFLHSRAKLGGKALEHEFFPIASYAPAGGI